LCAMGRASARGPSLACGYAGNPITFRQSAQIASSG
jgi:hypothetical protein